MHYAAFGVSGVPPVQSFDKAEPQKRLRVGRRW